jgi:hypothetical protein
MFAQPRCPCMPSRDVGIRNTAAGGMAFTPLPTRRAPEGKPWAKNGKNHRSRCWDIGRRGSALPEH